MREHRELTAFGFDSRASVDFEAARARLMFAAAEPFRRVVAWLRAVPRIKTPSQPSYFCKHRIERQVGTYVSEGVLLCACLHVGIAMRRYPAGRGALLAIPKRELRD
jgi:hypothetical protein